MNITKTFGPVWDASGLRGFFGEGYWFHRYVPGLDFSRSTFVAKTTTTDPNPGNMELRADFTPFGLFPDCVYVDWFRGVTLNAVGLSGPGAEALFETERWERIRDPFFISWMPIGKTPEEQCREAHAFVELIKNRKHFKLAYDIGIQLNVSCPNVGATLDQEAVLEKAEILLSILGELHLPIIVKLNLLVSPVTAARIAAHGACAGICITNTAPFGTVLPKEEWERLFPHGSPLQQYGGGGLSGPLLLPFVEEWVAAFRIVGGSKHVNAGGGIWRADNVDRLKKAGADSIFIGSVAMHRPWRVHSIIERAHQVFA